MKGSEPMPPVADDELLSRFVLHKSHFRRQDQTLKADPFIPHPHADLSVTRHLGLDNNALWDIAENVARQTGKTLYGRAENHAGTYRDQQLDFAAAPVQGNRNHTNVTGWPSGKPAQKMIALQIASNSRFVSR